VTIAGEARSRRALIALIGLVAALALLVLASLLLGAREISAATVWKALLALDAADGDQLLVVHIRAPRALVAVVAGAALGASGAVMQTLARNPLAEPGLLGVNAGASLGVVLAIAAFGVADAGAHLGFAMLGAALASLAVYVLGGIRGGLDPVRVVLAGAGLTVVLLGLTQIITINSDEAIFDQFRHWAVGSLEGRGYAVLGPVTFATALGLAILAAISHDLDAVALGEDLSRSLGANPTAVWSMAWLALLLLAGAAAAAVGPVSFVGLVAPHAARALAPHHHRWTIAYAAIVAALLMLAADCAGRVLVRPAEIDVGVMAALIGAPFFIALVRKSRTPA
jgi:ferric enterobactin transport system permease protein